MYDLYTPIVKDIDTKKTYDEAVATVKKAVKPLGEDYCKVFNKALDTDRWVDKYETRVREVVHILGVLMVATHLFL